jgi:hypothetical protein
MSVYLGRTSLIVLVIATVLALVGAFEHRAVALAQAIGARIEQEAGR